MTALSLSGILVTLPNGQVWNYEQSLPVCSTNKVLGFDIERVHGHPIEGEIVRNVDFSLGYCSGDPRTDRRISGFRDAWRVWKDRVGQL